jgi:hypothetical protein
MTMDDAPTAIPHPLAQMTDNNKSPALFVAPNHVPLAQMTMDEESKDDYVPSADDPPARRNTAKSHYKDKRESKTILMAMCYRLSNDEEERKLGDLQLEPYASSNIKKL